MLRIIKIIFIILFIFTKYTHSQNLVLNPSFEYYTRFPKKLNSEGHKLKLLKNWRQPTYGTCDYFNLSCKFSLTLVNDIGYQYPRTGDGMVGLVCNSIYPDYREYIEGDLLKTLIKDSLYCISFYVSLASKSKYAFDCMGLYLSTTKSSDISSLKDSYKPIKVTPQIRNPRGLILNSKLWVLVSGIYKAKGEEIHIIIGSFCNDNEQIKEQIMTYNPSPSKYFNIEKIAYYFIDDISVIPIKDSSECKCLKLNRKDSISKTVIKSENIIFTEESIMLDNIYFDKSNYVLLPQSYKQLDSIVLKILNEKKYKKIEIFGYTDNDGSIRYNLKLSENRAKAVFDYLILKGIPKERLKYKGYGCKNPIAPNDSEINKSKNRRIEFKIISE